MIKINLLPTKKKPPKKVTELQQQAILGSLILALLFLAMWFYYQKLNSQISMLNKNKAEAQAKIREQDNMLREVKTVEEERKKVTDKIGIIEQLKKNQSMLVHLLDDVSKALPQGVNIVSLSENNRQINLEGMAFTNNDVVKFVDNLKNTPSLSDVFLQETVQTTQAGVQIYRYKLQFTFKGA
jgi:type IV pilus assembly protein PilN